MRDRTCTVNDQCTKNGRLKRGLCGKHYQEATKLGFLDWYQASVPPPLVCCVDECVSLASPGRQGMCSMHAQRVRHHGDANYERPKRNGVELCRIDDCDEVSKAYLLCVRHATRYGRTGTTERINGVCVICATEFVRTGSRHVCCSIECRKELVARQGYVQRRKALEQAQTVERFTRKEIFERDGWICQLCYEPIDRQARVRASKSASLDHIIPLFHGGEHSRANTQCAHFGCNARKGARIKPPT